MMIEMLHTVIADIAMSCPLWSEDHASLTELEPVKIRGQGTWRMLT